MKTTVVVRSEREGDLSAIRDLNRVAFGTSEEADIIDRLRQQARPVISLVAAEGRVILGHIIFSPVSLEGRSKLKLMGLGPMAVSPGHQRRGIGSQLVAVGLKRCHQLPCAAVIVLGHPTYYPRFGFTPASDFGLSSEFDVPAEVFMALELEPGSLRSSSGTVRYHPAFAAI